MSKNIPQRKQNQQKQQNSLKSLNVNHHKQQMQSDRSNKIFSILKNTSDCLILQNREQKFIRKTFVVKEQPLRELVERQKLTHSNLINLHQIQFSHFAQDGKFAVDVVFDHYCKTLEQCVIGEQSEFDDSEIINTFQPIIEVVDHLLAQNMQLSEFSLKNIVITEDQNVKFLDSFFQCKEITKLEIAKDTNNFNDYKIYHKIADNILSLVCPKIFSNNWKTKLKLLKQKSSKEMCTFVSSILAKSLSKGFDLAKTKRIKKTVKVLKNENIEQPMIGKLKKQEKRQKDGLVNCEINMYGKHQGKENKLQQ